MAEKLPLRLAVYLDDTYREHDGAVYGNRAFVLFLGGVADRIERLLLLGRLDPAETRSHYRVPEGVEFVALPPYPSLVHVGPALAGMLRSLRRFWRLLDRVDAVWLLGPHPLALAFALMAALRRRGVALGVRQDWPTLVRNRHPGRRWVHVAADLLEGAYRLLARRAPTVVVGPQVAESYSGAPRLLEIAVSLVREQDVVEPARRPWGGRVLSVGRLDAEKNPLLLAEILRRLVDGGGDWRLTICGEGPLEGALRERLRELGVAERAELVGYLPIHGGLLDLYRSSDALLHVSLTEGAAAGAAGGFRRRPADGGHVGRRRAGRGGRRRLAGGAGRCRGGRHGPRAPGGRPGPPRTALQSGPRACARANPRGGKRACCGVPVGPSGKPSDRVRTICGEYWYRYPLQGECRISEGPPLGERGNQVVGANCLLDAGDARPLSVRARQLTP